MNALDASLEAVSVVFLLAAMLYSSKLLSLTKDAQILALSKPKTVFRLLAVAYAFLLLSPISGLISEFYPIQYIAEIQLFLIILTGFFGVMAIYTALYFYRTSPERPAKMAQAAVAK